MFELWDTLYKGGVLMIPIGLCSLIAVAVTVERLLSLREAEILPAVFLSRARSALSRGEHDSARVACRQANLGIARILEAGLITADQDREIMQESMEYVGRQEAAALDRYVGVLATVASVSPLLGLLGTVKGMIDVFQSISVHGVGDPLALSSGISEALLTTAAGLVVGIPTLVAHNFFHQKAQRLGLKLEKASRELFELMGRVPKVAGSEPTAVGSATLLATRDDLVE
ncbi:MAG: MotA/TolQ/ExbB proton channel family protein [Candidatus Schekmanbacteria bacterium]|nr:MotA/TolQ/ExbB proton channel family protein [Candidatus Schekmanbacteria bacterium]